MDTMAKATASEAAAIADVAERLRMRFPEVAAGEIDARVERAVREFEGRPVRDFVPVLVERAVINGLRGAPAR